jgi:hypothetical protein
MEQVLTDRALKGALQKAGLKRAREFSFAAMARETLGFYQQIVSGQ